jgi:hypothetical protein
MQIPSLIVEKAWENSGGYCQRCGETLTWKNRGGNKGRGKWVAHSISGLQKPSLTDYKILCWWCHRQTVLNRAHNFEKQFCNSLYESGFIPQHRTVQRSLQRTDHISTERK